MGETMVADRLPHCKSHFHICLTFSLKMAEEALKHLVDGVRVGILSFNFGQETRQKLTVSVEKDDLDLELFSYILPRPILTLEVREGRVEKKGGGGGIRVNLRTSQMRHWLR